MVSLKKKPYYFPINHLNSTDRELQHNIMHTEPWGLSLKSQRRQILGDIFYLPKPWWIELPKYLCWWEVVGTQWNNRSAQKLVGTPPLKKRREKYVYKKVIRWREAGNLTSLLSFSSFHFSFGIGKDTHPTQVTHVQHNILNLRYLKHPVELLCRSQNLWQWVGSYPRRPNLGRSFSDIFEC